MSDAQIDAIFALMLRMERLADIDREADDTP